MLLLEQTVLVSRNLIQGPHIVLHAPNAAFVHRNCHNNFIWAIAYGYVSADLRPLDQPRLRVCGSAAVGPASQAPHTDPLDVLL
jgi:hypothetical protein